MRFKMHQRITVDMAILVGKLQNATANAVAAVDHSIVMKNTIFSDKYDISAQIGGEPRQKSDEMAFINSQ